MMIHHSLANNQGMDPALRRIRCLAHIEAKALLSPKDWVMLYVRLKEIKGTGFFFIRKKRSSTVPACIDKNDL
jgi:hypothetical protein